MNRRIRNRTYGGVGGRRGQPRLLPDTERPIPFNPTTAISYQLPALSGDEGSAISFANLKIVDVQGKEIATLVNGTMPAGMHVVSWNGRDSRGNQVPSGVYFYTLSSQGQQLSRRMVLVK
ncbi:MAG: FlgD immunoglobulin-like domain containing protein [Ignavibacteria bacterium]|nr:FlgD immunoglobulin-like domain containing protein [Ignavibacteria bacterium]